MEGFGTFWQGLGPETKAALIGTIGTFVAAFLGFSGLIWQLRSQSRQGREAIAENERRKLKAAMYEDAVEVSRSLADAAIELSTYLRNMSFQIQVATNAVALNVGFQIPSARFPALSAAYDAYSQAALRFIFLVEHRRFIDPRLVIFRTAFNVVMHETHDLMFGRLVVPIVPALPTEGPNGVLFAYAPPSPEVADEIRGLCERLIASLDDAVSYTEDFLVELQNRLLGDLFGSSVPHRKPIDPNSKVITLDDADALDRWFKTSTAWGKKIAEVEAETRGRFGA